MLQIPRTSTQGSGHKASRPHPLQIGDSVSEMWELGCTGEFGCDCVEIRKEAIKAAKRYVHGTRGHYMRGCRCPLCREANNEYMRNYMKEKRRRARWNSEKQTA